MAVAVWAGGAVQGDTKPTGASTSSVSAVAY